MYEIQQKEINLKFNSSKKCSNDKNKEEHKSKNASENILLNLYSYFFRIVEYTFHVYRGKIERKDVQQINVIQFDFIDYILFKRALYVFDIQSLTQSVERDFLQLTLIMANFMWKF